MKRILLITIGLLTIFSCDQSKDTVDTSSQKTNDSSATLKETIFTGKPFSDGSRYDRTLKISDSGSVTLTAVDADHINYFEQKGKIIQVKDSIYIIQCTQYFNYAPAEDEEGDSLSFNFSDLFLIDYKVPYIKLIYSD